MKGVRIPACVLLMLAAGLSGCRSIRYQVNIGNGNPQYTIQEVEVRVDDKRLNEFPVIAPSKVAAAKPRRGKLPETMTVTWVDANGQPHEGTMALAGTVREDFRGQLVVEITEKNTLTLTQVESSGKEISTLPWALPEAWEGSVILPGMEQ